MLLRLEHLPSEICGTVVHHDDFVRHSIKRKLEVEMLDGGVNATLLVPCGDDNRERRERSSGLGFRRVWQFYSFPFQAGDMTNFGLPFEVTTSWSPA